MWEARCGTVTQGKIKNLVSVGQQRDVLQPRLRAPADEAVPTAQMTWRRAPGHTGDGPAARKDHVLQVLAHGLRVAQIVVLLQQAVEQRLLGRAPATALGDSRQ